MATVTVVGLGYVGLPLACLAVRKGHSVKGFDINPETVEAVNAGKSPIQDSSLSREISSLKGKLRAFTSVEKAFENAEVILVCVPTPVDKSRHPDLSPLKNAVTTIAKHIEKGALVIIESTIYPGVTEEIVLPIFKQKGLIPGKDFYLAHCPERIDPANPEWNVSNIPRVLGGIDRRSEEKAENFYNSILDAPVKVLSSLKAVEAVKITENTYRDINIAFVNELAQSFDKLGIDVTEVINAASTKPFGYTAFYPGPGVGGHCIPVDPYYLIERAKMEGFSHAFLELARKVNDSMPGYVVKLTEQELSKQNKKLENSKIAILGIAYKRSVDDARESPAIKIQQILKEQKANLQIFDPYIPEKSNSPSIEKALENADAIILATDHKEIVNALTPQLLKEKNIKLIIDARNALEKKKFLNEGINYKGIGR